MSKKNKKSVDVIETVDSKDYVKVTVTVENHCKGVFTCLTQQGQKVIGTPSGKMRMNEIHILPGDVVEIECSQYDLGRGRIVRRLSGGRQ